MHAEKDSISFGIMGCSVEDIVHAFHALKRMEVGNLVLFLDTELRCAAASTSLEEQRHARNI